MRLLVDRRGAAAKLRREHREIFSAVPKFGKICILPWFGSNGEFMKELVGGCPWGFALFKLLGVLLRIPPSSCVCVGRLRTWAQ
jgi:hypothetical protein